MSTNTSPIKARPKPQKPIDEWSIREKLALASSVATSGDQNWHSVSRLLRQFEPNRPQDWFNQKYCAVQYNELLDKVEMPKRKRGDRGEETAQDVIVRNLRDSRIEELKKIVEEDKIKRQKAIEEHALVTSGNAPESVLREIWARMKQEEKDAETAKAAHEVWLQERDVKIAASLRTRGMGKPVRPLSISAPSTPAAKIETDAQLQVDVDDTKPTIPSSAEPSAPTTPVSHVPSTSPLLTSLLQAGPSPGGSGNLKSPVAFREFKDMMSPTKAVTSGPASFFSPSSALASAAARQLSGSPTKSADGSPVKSEGRDASPSKSPGQSPSLSKLLEMPVTGPGQKLPPFPLSPTKQEKTVDESSAVEALRTPHTSPTKESEERAPAIDVEQPTPEQPEEPVEPMDDSAVDSIANKDIKQELVEKETSDENTSDEPVIKTESVQDDASTSESQADKTPAGRLRRDRKKPIPSPVTPAIATRRSGRMRGLAKDVEESPVPPPSTPTETSKKTSTSGEITDAASEESMDALAKPPPSMTPSISDSVPNSPASSTMHSEDMESMRTFRAWQKAIMIIWKQAYNHKHASIFRAPVTNDDAEGYTDVIRRPMDLMSIKKRIENQNADNAIRTTVDFQRDILQMFANAIMFNKPNHHVHIAAVEMQEEIKASIEDFIHSQQQQLREQTARETPSTSSDKPKPPPAVTPKPRVGRESRRSALSATPSTSISEDTPANRRKSRTSTDTDPGVPTTGAKTRTSAKKKAA